MRVAKIAFVSLLFVFTYCCKKVNVTGAQGPQGPDGPAGTNSSLSGTIQGKVILYDTSGNALTNNSGATIAIDNTAITGTSGADGVFSISNATAGIYNLTISRQGYGTTHVYHFLHTGGENASPVGNVEIGQEVSSYQDIKRLEVDTAGDPSYRYLVITITLMHPHKVSNPIIFFVNRTPGITKEVNDFNERAYAFQSNDSTLSVYPFEIAPGSDIFKFQEVDNIYMAVAMDNPHLLRYTDSLGYTIYPASGNLSNEVKVYNVFKQ